jgi:hypothetical protein
MNDFNVFQADIDSESCVDDRNMAFYGPFKATNAAKLSAARNDFAENSGKIQSTMLFCILTRSYTL